ncbi:MAG: SPOR domain-containing protein [Acidobacteriota bacterium]|nr:SPOR domain-containing protein [Acidobacteriota bacterium]
MNLLKSTCLSFVCTSVLIGLLLLNAPVAGQTQTRSFAIQVASAISEDGASAAIEELKEKGVEAYLVKSEVPGKGIRYRVRVGKFPNQQSAKSTGEKLTANGTIQEFAIMAYEPPSSASIARTEPKTKPTSRPDAEKARAEKPLHVQPEARAVAIERAENHNPAEKAKSPSEALAPSVESKVSAAKPKENKVESKPAIKPEPIKPTDAKPELDSMRNIPAAKSELLEKPVSNQPASEMTASMEPKIAAPPLADALTDASFTNSNWKLVRRSAETDKNLRALHFVDAMTGWAAGDAGAVYRTTDGGRTWKPLLSGVSGNINFIHFLDWNHGWMIAESNRKDEADGETVLLNTINGGRTWMIQKIPNLLSVYFTDLQNGWAVGRNATLLRTINGGNDWKPVEEVQSVVGLPIESSNYNFGFRDVYFLDANHGWLIGNFYGRVRHRRRWQNLEARAAHAENAARLRPLHAGLAPFSPIHRLEQRISHRRDDRRRKPLLFRAAHARRRQNLGTIPHAQPRHAQHPIPRPIKRLDGRICPTRRQRRSRRLRHQSNAHRQRRPVLAERFHRQRQPRPKCVLLVTQ